MLSRMNTRLGSRLAKVSPSKTIFEILVILATYSLATARHSLALQNHLCNPLNPGKIITCCGSPKSRPPFVHLQVTQAWRAKLC